MAKRGRPKTRIVPYKHLAVDADLFDMFRSRKRVGRHKSDSDVLRELLSSKVSEVVSIKQGKRIL